MSAKALNYYIIKGAIDNAPASPEGASSWDQFYVNDYVLEADNLLKVMKEVEELQLQHDVAYQQKNPNLTEEILSPEGKKPKYLDNLKVKMLVTNDETGEECEKFFKLKIHPTIHVLNGKCID